MNARALTARTVHLKLFPTPRTFPERMEVLRVIERFGEVAMFKSLKYEPTQNVPNAFFALFTKESSVEDLVNASPIRYRLITERSSANPSDPLISLTPEDAEGQVEQEEIMFELGINTTKFDHTLYISDPYTNPLQGPYVPVSPNRSYIAASLEENIPKSLWAAGLRDWETANLRFTNQHKALEDTVNGSTEESGAFFITKKYREKTERSTPRVMSGLKSLAEKSKEKRRKREEQEKVENEESTAHSEG